MSHSTHRPSPATHRSTYLLLPTCSTHTTVQSDCRSARSLPQPSLQLPQLQRTFQSKTLPRTPPSASPTHTQSPTPKTLCSPQPSFRSFHSIGAHQPASPQSTPMHPQPQAQISPCTTTAALDFIY